MDEVGCISTIWGIALDGRLYGSNGELIPIDDKKFAVVEDFYKLQAGMTYDQAVSILGKEHEIL